MIRKRTYAKLAVVPKKETALLMHSQSSSLDPSLIGVGAIKKQLTPQERVRGLWIISRIGVALEVLLIIVGVQ